ncbi:MAG: PQQ-dependent sugar dehydrogenase, partial [Thermocrispum sp.]
MGAARKRLSTGTAIVLAAGFVAATPQVATAVPPGFTDTVAISGLTQPTVAAFAPDGRVFVGEKSGIVKTYDSLADSTPTTTVDLRSKVHDFWDRGLLGFTVDPQYPARPYAYALYSYDSKPGGGQWGDTCPTPPGATDNGCVISARLSKLTLNANGVSTNEQPLITDWCQQYPSHSIGTVTFGPDGSLYVGGGDGASFNFADYGQ